jgi:hypothetical protein
MEAILKDCLTTLKMARKALDQWDKDNICCNDDLYTEVYCRINELETLLTPKNTIVCRERIFEVVKCRCVTECLFRDKIGIGSGGCQACQYFLKSVPKNITANCTGVVFCEHP